MTQTAVCKLLRSVVAPPANPTVRRKQLSSRLRRLRVDAGLTLEAAAAALEVSAATLSRIETGVRLPRARDVRDLCAFYGVTDPDHVAALTDLVTGARESGWWEDYTEVDDRSGTLIGLESAATTIEQFEATIVPGLLQTPEYTEALLREVVDPARSKAFSDHDIRKLVEIRGKRQRILDPDRNLQYSVVVDESVFVRAVGGPSVMRSQILRLKRAVARSNVNFRLIPIAEGAHPGQVGPFTVLSLPEDVSDVLHLESIAGQYFADDTAKIERCRRLFKKLQDRAVSGEEADTYLTEIAARFI